MAPKTPLLLTAFILTQLGASAQFDVCNFTKYLYDAHTPQLAKDIFLGRPWSLEKDGDILAVLDSLKARDKSSRAFYFKVVTKSYSNADGAYAEGLGGAGKEFVERNTPLFVSYFDNRNCFSSSDLETWAHIVMLELTLMADNMNGHAFFDEYVKKLNQNCAMCTPEQKATLNTFVGLLKNNWHDYLNSK